jgi:hypothetical protein
MIAVTTPETKMSKPSEDLAMATLAEAWSEMCRLYMHRVYKAFHATTGFL